MTNPADAPDHATPVADDSDADPPQRQASFKPTSVLFSALILWILSITAGTLLFGEVEDWRKPLLVLLPMALFLGLWGLLLWRKHSAPISGSPPEKRY